MRDFNPYTDDFLSQMRYKADPIADKTVNEILATGDKGLFTRIQNEVIYNQKGIPSDFPKPVADFFQSNLQLPVWANPSLMAKGASFFSKHSSEILLMLGLYSLPYCYAAANGAEVLKFSRRITDDPGKRFLETSEFVMDVMAPNAFESRGKGLRSVYKVRLIHAFARHYVQKNKNWNLSWGLPVNQEDMAGTNLAFSVVVLRGLRKSGITFSNEEAKAYMHLWKVIGHYLGIDAKLLPDTGKDAFTLDKKIKERQFRSSSAGEELTNSLIAHLTATSPPMVTKEIISSAMRFYLGKSVANLLNVPETENSYLLFSSLSTLRGFSAFLGLPRNGYYQSRFMISQQRKNINQS